MSIIFFAISGFLLGVSIALFIIVEKQNDVIRKAKGKINKLQTANEELFRQHLLDNGVSLEALEQNHEH